MAKPIANTLQHVMGIISCCDLDVVLFLAEAQPCKSFAKIVCTLGQCNTSFYESCAFSRRALERNVKLEKMQSRETFEMWQQDFRAHFWTLASDHVLTGPRSFWLLNDGHDFWIRRLAY